MPLDKGSVCPLRPSGTSPVTSDGGGFHGAIRLCIAEGDPSTKLLRSFASGTAQNDSVFFLRAATLLSLVRQTPYPSNSQSELPTFSAREKAFTELNVCVQPRGILRLFCFAKLPPAPLRMTACGNGKAQTYLLSTQQYKSERSDP